MKPFSCVRLLHSAARLFRNTTSGNGLFAYTTGATDLQNKIDKFLAQPPSDPAQMRESVVSALQASREELRRIHGYDKFGLDPSRTVVSGSIEKLLKDGQIVFDKELLREIFLMKFPSGNVIDIILLFYSRNPSAYIDLSTALIPLRDSLYNAELKDALKITDMTTGHPNYVAQKNTYMRHSLYRLAGTAIGITAFTKFGTQFAVDQGLLLEVWTQLSSLNSIILTYVINSSFFVAVVKFGRLLSAAGGDYLTWQKGTFYTHWYRYCDMMAMCAKIVETDVKLNGGVDNSKWLMEELCRSDAMLGTGYTLAPGHNREGQRVRLLEARENLEDLKMQAYWMTGGDGFEWVEPDQDPAEIIWRDHLQHLHSPAVGLLDGKSLKWAEDLIEEKKD